MTERHGTNRGGVQLPDDVTERIEARLPRTDFESVDDYAATALDLLLRQVAAGEADDEAVTAVEVNSDSAGANETDVENRDAVEEQLESLGYL